MAKADPDPTPPACFLDPAHVSKLTEQSNTKKNERTSTKTEDEPKPVSETERKASHKPIRLVRTVISSMKNTKTFGQQMAREAKRRRFGEAIRKAYQSQLRISHFRRVAGRMLWIRWLVGNASLVAGF